MDIVLAQSRNCNLKGCKLSTTKYHSQKIKDQKENQKKVKRSIIMMFFIQKLKKFVGIFALHTYITHCLRKNY